LQFLYISYDNRGNTVIIRAQLSTHAISTLCRIPLETFKRGGKGKGKGREREEREERKERKGKERKGKERKGKERKGKERKERTQQPQHNKLYNKLTTN
jgi:hypothetical protein